MKLALSLTLLSLLVPVSALAEAPRCENARLMKTLAQLMGGAELQVSATAEVVEIRQHGQKGQPPVLVATCDDVTIPLASQLERPVRGQARTVTLGPVTVSLTARGATSLDIAAGALQREAVQVLLFDDQSVSLSRGRDVLYAYATQADGTVVETEGRGVGCGCVRTTTPDGRTSTRPL